MKRVALPILSVATFLLASRFGAEAAHAQVASPPCVIEERTPFPAGQADTAAMLVCDALRAEGVPVTSPVRGGEGSAEVYRVRLGQLGAMTIVELAHERPFGLAVDARMIRVRGLDDLVVAGPRLARALVRRESIDETANVTNLVEQETRQPHLVRSESLWGINIGSTVLAGSSPALLYGAGVHFQHQTPHLALGGSVRLEGSDHGALFAVELGARYFLTDGEVSPYVGGGAGFYVLSLENEDQLSYSETTGTGAGFFGEIGVELARFQDSRLSFGLRVSAPLFTLDESRWDDATSREVKSSRYAVPVSVQVAYMF